MTIFMESHIIQKSIVLILFLFCILIRCGPTISIAGGDITFKASLSQTDPNYVIISLSTNINSGWAAVGLGSSMLNADVWMLSSGVGDVPQWNLTTRKSIGRSMPSLDSGQGVIILNYTLPKSAVFMRLIEPLSKDNNKFLNKSQDFIYAIRRKSYLSESQAIHEEQDGFNYNIFSSELQDGKFSYRTALLIHGILMAVSWSFLSFLAVFVARYMKKLIPSNWFLIHRVVFMLIFVMALTALGFAVYGSMSGDHFKSFHGIFGLIILISMTLQIILGIVIDKTFDSTRSRIPLRDKLHWFFGSVIVIAASSNVIIGHFSYGTNVGLIIFNIVVIVLILTGFVVAHFLIGQQHESK